MKWRSQVDGKWNVETRETEKWSSGVKLYVSVCVSVWYVCVVCVVCVCGVCVCVACVCGVCVWCV